MVPTKPKFDADTIESLLWPCIRAMVAAETAMKRKLNEVDYLANGNGVITPTLLLEALADLEIQARSLFDLATACRKVAAHHPDCEAMADWTAPVIS